MRRLTRDPRTRSSWSGKSARPARRCWDPDAALHGSDGCRSRNYGILPLSAFLLPSPKILNVLISLPPVKLSRRLGSLTREEPLNDRHLTRFLDQKAAVPVRGTDDAHHADL